MNCTCACDWFQPPMIPNAALIDPPVMKPGMMVCSGRLRGASAFGCAGSSVNNPARLCSAKPVPSGTRPDPKFAKLLWIDRKSTRLNSSHSQISYAVFCLKKKKKKNKKKHKSNKHDSKREM